VLYIDDLNKKLHHKTFVINTGRYALLQTFNQHHHSLEKLFCWLVF